MTDALTLVSAVTGLAPLVAGGAFSDDQMAAAVIDRVVHHGRPIQFRTSPTGWGTRSCATPPTGRGRRDGARVGLVDVQ